jgi:hypothetical protein
MMIAEKGGTAIVLAVVGGRSPLGFARVKPGTNALPDIRRQASEVGTN